MESVNYKSLEEANNLLNEDDLPSSNSKAPPSPSPSIRSRSRSKSPSGNQLEYDDVGDSKSPSTPLKSRHGENNNHNSAAAGPSTAMECGPRNLIIVAGICFLFASVLVVIITVALYAGGDSPSVIRGLPFKDAISGTYYPNSASLSWISSHTFIQESQSQLKEVEVNNGTETVLVKNLTALSPDRDTRYHLSKDKKFVLYTTRVKPIYRHTKSAQYTILDVDKDKHIPLLPSPASPKGTRLQYASWSPTGNSLTFVYENDLYFVSEPTATPLKPVRLTTDGEPAVVFNGVPDWVYEEEVFASDHTVYWSPSGSRLAFIQFNDTQVPTFTFPLYGSSRDAYTKPDVFRYPKAGFTNPTIKLFVRDLNSVAAAPDSNSSSSKNVELTPPSGHGLGDDYLIGNVKFRDEDSLLVIWTNRVQNESVISLCNVGRGSDAECHENLRDDSSQGWSWVMPKKELFLARDGSKYFLVLPKDEPEGKPKDSFPHVAMVTTSKDVSKKGDKSYLTSGEKEVESLLAVRRFGDSPSEHQLLLYISTLPPEGVEDGARQRHLFVVDTQSLTEKCLSCDEAVGRGCTYFSASVFPDSQEKAEDVVYFVLTCRSDAVLYEAKSKTPVVPFTATFRYDHATGTTQLVKKLEDNADFAEKLSAFDWPSKAFFTAPIRTDDEDDGLQIRGQLFLPPFFAEMKKKKHPILFSIYSGPSTTKVNDRFALDWHSYMAINHGFVIVNIDGRGSSMRGNKLRFSMYRRLGGPEIDDVVIAAEYLLNESEWKENLDADRVGVWGWSYGGYATSHVLGRGSGVFTCGAAVAPVTSWNYYDSIYTERYMSTPADNPSGYEGTRVMDPKRVEHFRDVHYLLIHGTADDNVHFQNAMHLTTALIGKEIAFETQVYPDKTHSISGHQTRAHLYTKLTDFFLNKCQRKEKKESAKSRSKRSVEGQEKEEEEEEDRGYAPNQHRAAFEPACFEKDFGDCL